MSKENPKAIIVKTESITPKVRHITLELAQKDAMSYMPGQFISVHLTDPNNADKKLRRSYSISNISASTSGVVQIEIVLTVIKDGLASQFFDTAPLQTSVEISGPYGALILPEEIPDRLFLVATSTGVAPYRTMLPELERLLNSEKDFDVELILGISTPEETLFANDFREFSQKYPHFQFNACYSRHKESGLGEDEHQGYVTARLEQLAPNPKNDLVFLCGNPKMVDNCTDLLSELGFSPRQVKREKYVHSKR